MIIWSGAPAKRAAVKPTITQRSLAELFADQLRKIPGVSVVRRGCRITVTPTRPSVPVVTTQAEYDALYGAGGMRVPTGGPRQTVFRVLPQSVPVEHQAKRSGALKGY